MEEATRNDDAEADGLLLSTFQKTKKISIRQKIRGDFKELENLQSKIVDFAGTFQLYGIKELVMTPDLNFENFDEEQIDALYLCAAYFGNCELLRKLRTKISESCWEKSCCGFDALHLSIIGSNFECADEILKNQRHLNFYLNSAFRGYPILHFACYLSDANIVQLILHHLKRNSDFFKELNRKSELFPHCTALHMTTLSDFPEVAKLLLENGAETEVFLHKTKHTPLHLAAIYKNSQIALDLMKKGASPWASTNKGMTALSIVAAKIPETIDDFLNSFVTLEEAGESERIVLDFSKLQRSPTEFRKSLPTCFVACDLTQYLQHPLCRILLSENWTRIRKWYFTRLVMVATLLLFTTTYFMTFHAGGCTVPFRHISMTCNNSTMFSFVNGRASFDTTFSTIFYIAGILTVADILRKVIEFFIFIEYKSPIAPTIKSAICRYFCQITNYLEWFCLITTLSVYCQDPEENSWHSTAVPVVILLSWINFMIWLGQLPIFGAYVEMYLSVLNQFLKLLLAYSCVLIGYALSFYVIFKDDKNFASPIRAVFKTITMMTGEYEYNDLFEESANKMNVVNYFVVQLIFVTFVISITIVLMNLLIGIVVHDVSEIKKSAMAKKLKRKVELIEYLEMITQNVMKNVKQLLKMLKFRSDTRQTHFEPYIVKYKLPVKGDFENEAKLAAWKIALAQFED